MAGVDLSDFCMIIKEREILPTSKNAFCVYKCTACQVVNIELMVNLNLEKTRQTRGDGA